MPLPRYQPVKKRPKIETAVRLSLNNLDDYCVTKIISHLLRVSSNRDDSTVCDNGATERNLSLVSKRWYFLTQAQVNLYGVHRIDLDKITRQSISRPLSSIAYVPQARRPGVLMPKNHNQQPNVTTKFRPPTYDITLIRAIKPKLLKYKHILIDGCLTSDEFKKLIVTLNSARIEQLRLNVKIQKDVSQAKETVLIPHHLCYLESLTLLWTNDSKSDFSNAMMWTIYERAVCLKTLDIHLEDQVSDSNTKREPIERVSDRLFSRERDLGHFAGPSHPNLGKIIFKRTSPDSQVDCIYTSLIKGILRREDTVSYVNTNDNMLIDHIIRSSDRICTTLDFRLLKFLAPVKDMNLFEQLFKSKTLGSDLLSVVIDNIDQLEEVRNSLENFKPSRHEKSVCQLSLHLRDQKVSDSEDRIKNLIQLSRLCELIIHISAQQRVSIDCCHLMWSVGRALQVNETCLFKITLQVGNQTKVGQTTDINYTEITIPFGQYQHFKINSSREDLVRHREIMKSLKRDCYHQFVKSVRDNV